MESPRNQWLICNAGDQRGHVAVYSLAILIVMILASGYIFNSGQVANEKTRLQNTVDAVTFSVAAVEAKDLNFKAYTNRAMVANQVAIAQTVSLVSWARFTQRYSENITRALSWIPYAGAIFASVGSGIKSLMQALERIISLLTTGLNGLEQMLSASQSVFHAGTLALINDTYKNVVKMNDKDVDLSLGFKDAVFLKSLRDSHGMFTRQYKPRKVDKKRSAFKSYGIHKQRMDEFREVILNSRDGFSTNRSYTYWGEMWLPLPGKFGSKFRIDKAGGTELLAPKYSGDPNYYTWAAMDTLSVHRGKGKLKRSGWKLKLKYKFKELFPVGWGAAQTGKRLNFASFQGSNFGSTWKTNRIASKFAVGEFGAARQVGTFSGLQPFYDIRQDGLLTEAPGVTLLLAKPHKKGKINTLKHTSVGENSSRLNLEEKGGMLNGRLASIGRAVPYFSRPDDVSVFKRKDRFREYGNLYNPFWQPKLEPVRDKGKILRLAATLL
ncbi:TadE/TadG family type IV pilus assembly protein [Marinobacter salicampi]|uniref:TadE/TadG family type IV pilus assembly protein n=1 Tax=Marinobacter salicampi TaxID=435907 RepID=UPI00140834D4|nr:pilus assembly protein TadG-related protein [Marinobacter salicampi]